MLERPIQNNGFTLIELTLYVGIASIMIIISSLFLSTLLQSRVKNQTITEVDQQGLQVLQIITQTIRNSKTINNLSSGNQNQTLSLDTYNTNSNPVIFYISNGAIMIQEGSDTAIPLTNSRVQVSSLNFSNMSNSEAPGIISLSFTLTHLNPQNWNEYDYKKTFYASASLR